MAIVMYDGKRLIPAPLVNISKEYQTTSDGKKIGALFTITLTGRLFAKKGSPNYNGVWYTGSLYPPDGRSESTFVEPESNITQNAKIASLIRKQEAMRSLFSEDGKQFEVQDFDGHQPMKCNPMIKSINFPEGAWVDYCDYSIVLETSILSVNGSLNGEDVFFIGEDSDTIYLSSLEESWSIETVDEPFDLDHSRSYTMTHTVSATGKRQYDDGGELISEAWEQAKNYIENDTSPTIGFNASILAGSLGGASGTAYNHIRNESIDIFGGGYSISETWLVAPGSASETFEISTTKSSDSGFVNVSVNGSIQGLESRNSEMTVTSSKYTNATSKWTTVQPLIITRAQSYSGVVLNIRPISELKSENPAAGTINYTYEYNNRPSNLITGSSSELISIVNTQGVDVFAAIPVLGRAAGPVFQNIGTQQPKVKSLNIEVVMNSPTGALSFLDALNLNPLAGGVPSSEIQAIVDYVRPVADSVFVSNQNESWDVASLRASLLVEWTYGN